MYQTRSQHFCIHFHELPMVSERSGLDRIHGKQRKAVKRIFRQVRRDVKEQYALFNSYVGRENVQYIHARLGSTSWTDDKTKAKVTRQPWFLAKVDDSFDSSYCDISARIGKEEA